MQSGAHALHHELYRLVALWIGLPYLIEFWQMIQAQMQADRPV